MKKVSIIFIILTLVLFLNACGKDKHEHYMEDELFRDNINHWYECKCKEIMYSEPHQMSDWIIELEPTEETEGLKYQKCFICDYKIEANIPMTKHEHAKKNELFNDSINHWYECICGEKMNIETHQMSDWIIELESTEETEGLKYQECLICDYKIEEVIPVAKHNHTMENEIIHNTTQHWYKCSCGEKMNVELHRFNAGYVKVPATMLNGGKIGYECTVCGYEKVTNTNPIYVNSLVINGFNELDGSPGIKIFEYGKKVDNDISYHKVLLTKIGNYYKVIKEVEVGISLTGSYDYVLIASSLDLTGEYDKLIYFLNVDDETIFSKDLATLSEGKVNITLTKQMASDNNPDDNPNEKPDENIEVTKEEVLDYISDIVTSNTLDNLPTNINGVSVIYTSSDTKLYTIEKGTGHTNRRYQTHWKEKVTVYATLSNGTKYSKEITINPVTYDNMDHPKAVYFSVSSASSYKKYSERYKKEQTLFSDKFKSNMNMVYYAFAIPQENGTLTLDTTYLEEILELKNHGIRVLMVIDGANSAPLKAMVRLCDNSLTRETFVKNILDLVTTYNFDGVDVDWEFPGILSSQAGYEKYTTAVDIKNLNSLLKELREGFNALQDNEGSNYILSAATPPTDWGTDRFDYATINKYCDYVNMMSYDLNKSNVTSHLTHVYQPSNSYSYKFCCDFGVSYYTSLGLDRSKIILGAAAYGKAYKVSGSTPNSKLPGLGMNGTLGQVSGFGLAGQSITWNSGTIYYTGIQTLINSGKFTQYNEYNNSGKLVGSYLYNDSDKYFITFDSVLSVIEKCKYAAGNKGMGIMVWAYGEDATDTIVNTICDNL